MTGPGGPGARVLPGADGVVAIEGEIDIANIAAVEGRLRGAMGDAVRLTVDLSGLDYADSAFLRMLLDLAAECAARGGRLAARAAEGTYAHDLLRLASLDTALGPPPD
jgi:anti-anti-sigma factor